MYPISRQQQRVIDHFQDHAGIENYILISIKGDLDISAIENFIRSFAADQENLRVTLQPVSFSKYPMQVVGDKVLVKITSKNDPESNKKEGGYVLDVTLVPADKNSSKLHIKSSPLFSDYASLLGLYKSIGDFISDKLSPSGQDKFQYIDFTEWQRQSSLQIDLETSAGTEYWKNSFTEPYLAQRIAFDYAELGASNSQEIDYEEFHAGDDFINRLQEAAARNNIHFTSLLMAHWWRILLTYADPSCSMAYKHPGRSDEKLVDTFGLFEVSLPVPGYALEYNSDVVSLAIAIEKEKEKQHEFLDYFCSSKLKAAMLPYQFEFHHWPDIQAGNFQLSVEAAAIRAEKFALKLSVIQKSDSTLHFSIGHDQRDFPKSFIQFIKDFFCRTLLNDLSDREDKNNDLGFMMQSRYTPPQIPQAGMQTLIAAFEDSADRFSTLTAISTGNASITYGDLNSNATKVAGYIASQLQSQEGGFIAVQLKDPLQMVTAFLAILKTGRAFLPIDADTPTTLRNYIIKDSAALVLIADEDSEAEQLGVNFFSWKDAFSGALEHSKNDQREAVASDPCYLIYTSGTTGVPKGVSIAHSSLLNYVNWFTDEFSITEKDHSIVFSSICFDLGYTSLWPVLLKGGCVYFKRPDDQSFLESIIHFITSNNITFIKCTPSHFKQLLAATNFNELGKYEKLRMILLGGEPIQVSDLRRFFQSVSKTLLVNHYGPTESTIGVIIEKISSTEVLQFERHPVIGSPIGGHQIFILDDEKMPVPVGVFGELHIAGPGLSAGYWNNAELTAKSFVTLKDLGNKRYYASGDIARWLPNGKIELKGRKDDQLKVNGYRVEPQQVSLTLQKHPLVKSAVTLGKQYENDGWFLISFVIPDSVEFDAGQVKQFLASELPSYMIPSHILEIQNLPLTSNGKLDKKMLLQLFNESVGKEAFVETSSEVERSIQQIWCEQLQLERLSVDKNYFEIGGHSLAALQMLARVKKDLGVYMPVYDFYSDPTILSLANYIENARRSGSNLLDQYNIPNQAPHKLHDVSFSQYRIWLQTQVKKTAGAYNVSFIYKVDRTFDIQRLVQLLRILVLRHESLRLNFIVHEGELKQCVKQAEDVDVKIKLISTGVDNIHNINEAITQEQSYNFNLETDPLYRFATIDSLNHGIFFIFTFHHIIIDAWSIGIFQKELVTLIAGNELNLPPVPHGFTDYVVWEKNALSGDGLDRMRAFFKTQLGNNIPELNLDTDFPRKEKEDLKGASYSFLCSSSLHKNMVKFCAEQKVTLFAFLNAAVKVLLFRLSNQNDITLGMVEANRQHPDFHDVMGCFFNVIAVRTRFSRDVDFLTFLKQVHHELIGAQMNAAYPFDFVIQDANVKRSPGRSPLFDVMITFQKHERDVETPEQFEEYHLSYAYSKYDLMFNFKELKDGIDCIVEYDNSLFADSRIHEFIALFETIVTEVLENAAVQINMVATVNVKAPVANHSLHSSFNF